MESDGAATSKPGLPVPGIWEGSGTSGIQAGYRESHDLSMEASQSPQSSYCSFSTNLNHVQRVMSRCKNYGDATKHELKFPENPNSGWNLPQHSSCQWKVEGQVPDPWEKRDCSPRGKKTPGCQRFSVKTTLYFLLAILSCNYGNYCN